MTNTVDEILKKERDHAKACVARINDDNAVLKFAEAMRDKMALSREKGRSGWDDPTQCTVEHLARLLVGHLAKGDPVDIANFAMMLHQRNADPSVLQAEVERLRVVKLPEITDEIAEELGDSSLVERCPISTIPSLWTWTQDVVDFVGILNEERK